MPVYFLKIEPPLPSGVDMYVGFAHSMTTLKRRINHHRKGTGAKMTRAAVKVYHSELILVHTIPTGTRQLERRIKNQKAHRRVLDRIQRGTFKYIQGDLQ